MFSQDKIRRFDRVGYLTQPTGMAEPRAREQTLELTQHVLGLGIGGV